MKIKITILAVALSTILNAQTEAPGILWKKYISSNADYVHPGDLDQLSDGSYLISGTQRHSVDGSYISIPQLTKTSSSGETIWQKQYSNISSNNVINSDIDTSGNIFSITEATGNANNLLVKFDSNGNLLWQKGIQYSSYETFASYIDVLPDNSILMCGDYEKSDAAGYFFAKYDNNGNQLWIKTVEYNTFPGKYIDKIIATADGGFVAKGEAWDSEDTDLGYLVRFDAQRNLVWEKFLKAGTDETYIYDILMNANNEIVISGFYNNINNDDQFMFINKKNLAGDDVWFKSFYKPEFEFVYESMMIELSTNEYTLAINTGYGNGVTILKKINNNGENVWEHVYNDDSFGKEYLHNIIKTSDNHIGVLTRNEDQYGLYKMGGSLGLLDFTKKGLTVYPNPARNVLHFSETVSNIKIADFSGKIVKNISTEETKIDVSDLPKGIYIVTVITKDGKSINHKVIKE